MFDWISNLALAAGQYFGWAKQRDAEKNTLDQQSNEQAKSDQEERTRAEKDLAKGNPDELRRDIS